MPVVGTVTQLWRYPVKSMQGRRSDSLAVTPTGVEGDRTWALIDAEDGSLISAKRRKDLLFAAVGDSDASVELPDGVSVRLGDPGASDALSAWLGRAVEVRAVADAPADPLTYQMTFDPPDDDAEYYEIPAPVGTFLDWAPVHLLHEATLLACSAARRDLDWSVRRFRPNLVIDGHLDAPFGEQAWVGRSLRFGPEGGDGAVLAVQQPTVRCAMPLRAQPLGIAREPGIFHALTELNPDFPNHLGLYLTVVTPGRIEMDAEITLLG